MIEEFTKPEVIYSEYLSFNTVIKIGFLKLLLLFFFFFVISFFFFFFLLQKI